VLISRALFIAACAAPAGGGGITSSDSDVAAWNVATKAAGGNPSQAYVNALTTMVSGMKSDTDYANLDWLFVYAAEDVVGGSMDVVARRQHVTSGHVPTFVPMQGFKGDGTSTYIDLGFPVTMGPHFTQNSACVGIFVQVDDSRGLGTSRAFCGSSEAPGVSRAFIHRSSNGVSLSTAMNNSGNDSISVSNYLGLLHHERTGASTTATYQSGTSKGTGVSSSLAVLAQNMYVLAGNNNPAAIQFTDARVLVCYGGGALGASGVGRVSSRVSTFLAAIGAS
jgi:hypothetical protein